MASPFVSVKSDKPHSIIASAPMGVFVDIDIIKKAPAKLLASGCGDLIANIIAVKDWQLGHEKKERILWKICSRFGNDECKNCHGEFC